jgi:LacI family transcriptional regulator
MPDSSPQRVNLQDIATKLGVSRTAVSLALAESPRVSQQLHALAKKTAEEMGYRPDPMLSALANFRLRQGCTKISAAIAWINAWRNPEDLRHYREFDLYWKGAERAARKSGYVLEEFRVGKNCTPKRLHEILQTRAIHGILLPPHSDPPDLGNFPWEHYSVVRYGRSITNPRFHLVTADQVRNTVLAFEKIRERGYERIGFVDCPEFSLSHHQFLTGFLDAQLALDESLRIPVLDLRMTRNTGRYEHLAEWVRKHRVEAILTAFNQLPAILEKAGLRVPDDVALAGTTVLDTPITAGIDQNPEEIGRVGFLLLNSLIHDRTTGVPQINRQSVIEGSWVDGDSLPHRRQTSG